MKHTVAPRQHQGVSAMSRVSSRDLYRHAGAYYRIRMGPSADRRSGHCLRTTLTVGHKTTTLWQLLMLQGKTLAHACLLPTLVEQQISQPPKPQTATARRLCKPQPVVLTMIHFLARHVRYEPRALTQKLSKVQVALTLKGIEMDDSSVNAQAVVGIQRGSTRLRQRGSDLGNLQWLVIDKAEWLCRGRLKGNLCTGSELRGLAPIMLECCKRRGTRSFA